MNSIENELLAASQSFIIIGWFWLIVYTIFRAENFKKRYFTTLLLIYFIQGVVKVSELLMFETDKSVVTLLSITSNVLCIAGFAYLTSRYIKFKIYFDEKTNVTSISDAINHGVMFGTKSLEKQRDVNR